MKRGVRYRGDVSTCGSRLFNAAECLTSCSASSVAATSTFHRIVDGGLKCVPLTRDDSTAQLPLLGGPLVLVEVRAGRREPGSLLNAVRRYGIQRQPADEE